MKQVVYLAFALAGLLRGADDPQFTKDNELIRPANYREWIYLTSGLGMSYGVRPVDAGNPAFDNVFVQPAAYKAFKKTGKWPDKTMFVLEIRSSESHGSINKAGHYQTDLVSLDAAVKDVARFKEKWAYFGFKVDPAAGGSAKAFAGDSACNVCHAKNAAVENTFVQFYPTLLGIARAKGTINAGYNGDKASGMQ